MTVLRAAAALALGLSFLPGFQPCAYPGDVKRKLDNRLPLSGLAPSKIVPDLCLVRYRVSTSSPECQAFFDQGLGYFYSYVWMEAARSFETATQYDPHCALAWWGLSRALERWGRGDATRALLKAEELKAHASHREQQLIRTSMLEKGQAPDAGDGEERKKKAIATLDNMLALYDDDEEGWYFRAQLSGGAGGFGGQVSAVPLYKALLRVNPLHPGANHELVHFYENYHRPALGWVYAENYIQSSPGIPHPFHMQAHLATRLGRWDKTSDRSARAIELERAYHKLMNVKPSEDSQFAHHLEVLLLSLTHDGRFREARVIEQEGKSSGYKPWVPWFRLHLAERAWPEALQIVEQLRKTEKSKASYLAALVYLKQGQASRALPEVEVLQHAFADNKNDKNLEYWLWEAQGLYLCQTGSPDVGLKLLAKAVERSKNDYGHHAWGNGAYFMEAWGIAALQTGRAAVAEEAFLEALAHDPGSVRAALGLQVLCEEQGRSEEAERYADLARRCWARADAGCLETELAALRTERYAARAEGPAPPGWLPATAHVVPKETATEGEGYFSIIEGHNGRLYVGTHVNGANAYLVEFDPATGGMKVVVDAQKEIGTKVRGFAAQAKIHTRNNVGASGKIYFGTKQGYPSKDEKYTDYPGGYPMAYDPKTGKTRVFPIPVPHQGINSITPDESRGVAYVSTCSDRKPGPHESAHLLILNLQTGRYRDLIDTEHPFGFIVLDHRGRAYHPARGGTIIRYDPATDRVERLEQTIDGEPPIPESHLADKDCHPINWDISPDGKTLYALPMSTNQLYAYDLSRNGGVLEGRSLGTLVPGATDTDCRALCVGPKGDVWAAVTVADPKVGRVQHLVRYRPGDKAPRDLGRVAVKNPDFTTFTGKDGKPLPFHGGFIQLPDGTTTTRYVVLGVCQAKDGRVYTLALHPYTVLEIAPEPLP